MAVSTGVLATSFGRTNLGPLTTAFSYPASCTVNVEACSTCPTVWQAQTCGDNEANTLGIQDDPGCWPSRANTDITTGKALNGWGFYSPGISCPVGYETRCSASGSRGGFTFQFPLSDGEVAFGCCPRGYACLYRPGLDRGQTCYSIGTEGVVIQTMQCSSGTVNATGSFTMPITTTGTTDGGLKTSGSITTMTMYAPLFQLMVQPSDTGAPASSGGPPGSSPPAGSGGGGGGLSTGAAAGIGVACGVVGIALLAGVVFMLLRRRKKKKKEAPEDVPLSALPKLQAPPDAYKTLPAGHGELDSVGAAIYEAPYRPSQWAHARPAGEAPAELPVTAFR